MANIAIFRINYKSDFILTLNSDAGWMTPFCIKFWTGAPSQAYFAGYDGETYTHCAPVAGDPTRLEVQFDDHHLPIGDLKFQIGYHFTVADFPTTVEDEVINQSAVIIDQDGTPMQVMLDLNGETAPEIQFSLPAYANEAQRIANEEQRIANETQRIGNEETRIQHEESRIAAEQTRQQNEQQRINQEQARIEEYAGLKADAVAATGAANDAAALANQKAQLAADKAALAQDASDLANAKAQLAADKAALAESAATLANQKAALAQQKAEYAQEQGTYSKNQGDYAKEQGDYSKAQGDYAKDQGDYSKSKGDYAKNQGDYSKQHGDYAKEQGEICAADHLVAVEDHQTAAADHQTATTDHSTALSDHTRAESDHTRAESDHAAVEVYVDSLGVFDLSKHNAVGGVLATYADLDAALTALNALESKYKYGGMSFKFVQTSDNKYVQYRLMSTAWSINAADWAIADEGVYVENPEFVYVKTDAEDKILWAIKKDGGIYYGAGVPQQVIDYINEKIAELSLDEYEDIVAFLNGLEEGEQTLQQLLNEKANADDMVAALATKVDKVEGKGLSTNDFTDDEKAVVDTSTLVENPEFIEVELDAEDKVLGGRKVDGTKFENNDFELNGNATVGGSLEVDGVVIKNIEDPENRSEITLDAEEKIVSYRKDDGTKVENVGIETPNITAENISAKEVNIEGGEAILNKLNLTEEGMTEFQQALKYSGFRPGGAGDWSDYISKKGKDPLHLPVPRLAYINLTNADGNLTWPTSKTADFEAIMEFADMQGNYFKKNIIFNAQGNSSMAFIKKNGSIKMFDSSVYNSKGKKGKGDKFGVKFGDWVSQTTYHVKAFYTDYFKGVSYISYQLALEVANTHNEFENRTWKKGLFKDMDFTYRQFDNPQIDNQDIQIDNGALCQPDGFPCIIYLNGDFYGIYVWFIKKDAANFNMDGNNPMHIHLDGRIDNSSLFNADGNAANIKWNPTKDSDIEVRHPEDLVTMDGEKYDSDVDTNQELAGVQTPDAIIPSYSDSETYSKSDISVVNGRVYLSLSDDNIGNDPEEAKCSEHGDEFDKATDYWIDITFTNEVKKAILRLSKYKSDINNGGSIAEKKLLFEEYFDLDNQIDYQLVQEATNDSDGFGKNWQWTTWDGVKWFINNYDKDCAFGGSFEGTFTGEPQINKQNWKGYNVDSFNVPFLVNNYSAELKIRWEELVDKNIFTKEHIISLFDVWVKRIGSVNYNKEYTKWDQAPCNRDSGINTEYWKVVSWAYHGDNSNYDPETNYSVGDTCKIKVHTYTFTFECINACQNESPIIKTYTSYPTMLGYRDNLWRVCKYIEQNISAINEFIENI